MPNPVIYIPYVIINFVVWVDLSIYLPDWASAIVLIMVAPYICVTVEHFVRG